MTYDELVDAAAGMGMSEQALKGGLSELERMKEIASRRNGGILTYYVLQQRAPLNRVLIVEDDKHISKLMALSVGQGFEIDQLYDGGDALPFIRKQRPALVVLDLMLPHKNGLDICETIKSDPELKQTVVIIVSAMEPTSNRFRGIRYGADYYIKKPFDPKELKILITLFLQKKGKRFDPLIDLPDEERISKAIESHINASDATIGTLRIKNLGSYAMRFGEQSAMVILRLVSQLLQDTTKHDSDLFVGFLNSEAFILAGKRESIERAAGTLQDEFTAVWPFILQDIGYKNVPLDIESIFESKEVPRLALVYEADSKNAILERRNAILKSRGALTNDIGSYTYEELQRMVGNAHLDIKITRTPEGIRMQVSHSGADGEDDSEGKKE